MKELFERIIAASRFNMNNLVAEVRATIHEHPDLYASLASIETQLDDGTSAHVLKGVLRTAFLIEIVNERVTSTKFDIRWTERLRESSDPRYASFETCYEIFAQLLSSLDSALADQEKRELLTLMAKKTRVPYELPIDYTERRQAEPMHQSDNVGWLWEETPSKVVKLRHLLLDPDTNPQVALFQAAYDKIEVKTYLTDRAVTGLYKSNREKRWEAHPASVQFALRSDCLQIEYTLLNQLCHFDGFDQDLLTSLEDAELLEETAVPFRCPVTMDPLSFAEFERGLSERVHGKSSFQVGHLNPLKAINEDPQSGHTAQNISWISADGNRIQGSLSLAETRALLERIQQNYDYAESP